MIIQGSGFVLDENARVIATFDRVTHTLETTDPKVIKLCKRAGFKEVKAVPKVKEIDPFYEDTPAPLPTKAKPAKKEVKK